MESVVVLRFEFTMRYSIGNGYLEVQIMAAVTLEERLATVEQELAKVKRQLAIRKTDSSGPWWEEQVGVFADDPLYDEAMRLGRAWRESQFDEAE
jgi:hypothetical protein